MNERPPHGIIHLQLCTFPGDGLTKLNLVLCSHAYCHLPHASRIICLQLHNMGFCNFFGVDGSHAMLDIAKKKGLYKELKQCMLGMEPLPVQTGMNNLSSLYFNAFARR